ncbi:pseudouridine-5'-phosphatase [Elysia marginata]|uniref:Pseudouridine-5'-phosphatase n=1 Tax=Elysia marginata TaxID=1093978 RepID=A0AAV4G6U0_9GAST|nr:pseudouridine-5'-phosphatase [Elysia marginata]
MAADITHVIFDVDGLIVGAEKLIRHLHHHKVPIAVATGSDKWGFAKKTASHAELFTLFHHAVCASDDPDVKHGKPAPDCFLVCAGRFPDAPKPDQVLVLEDAPNGAEAGLNAGMHVVWVPDPRADRSSLGGRVDQVLDSLEQFVPEKFGLPPYNAS